MKSLPAGAGAAGAATRTRNFLVCTASREYELRAATEDAMVSWLDALCRASQRLRLEKGVDAEGNAAWTTVNSHARLAAQMSYYGTKAGGAAVGGGRRRKSTAVSSTSGRPNSGRGSRPNSSRK